VARIFFSFTSTAPTCRRRQEERRATSRVISMKYSSQPGRVILASFLAKVDECPLSSNPEMPNINFRPTSGNLFNRLEKLLGYGIIKIFFTTVLADSCRNLLYHQSQPISLQGHGSGPDIGFT
jgi:hypothetical protein